MNVAPFEIRHPAGLLISPLLREQELLAAFPSCAEGKRSMGNGWVWYSLPRFEAEGKAIAISLAFCESLFRELHVSDASPRFGSGWNDWSEEKERQRATSSMEWLRSLGFQAGRYSWGEVWGAYDPKGGFGLAGVRCA